MEIGADAQLSKVSISHGEIVANLELLQKPIERMASNSTLCKGWCITIVSAMLVLVADKGKPEFIFLTIVPLVGFFFLDAYYLFMERCFRRSYENFAEKVRHGLDVGDKLYSLSIAHEDRVGSIEVFSSVSLWWFYGMILIGLFMARHIIG